MVDDTDNEEILKSRFNSAALINLRLDNLWKDTHKHSRACLYLKWNEDLDRIWMELGGDATKEEEKEFLDLDTGKEGVCSFGRLINGSKGGFQEYGKDEVLKIVKQKRALMRKELFLRRMLNKQGKGTAYDEDSDDFE